MRQFACIPARAGIRRFTKALVTKYQKRILGTMLDRIDIHIEVPRVNYEKLSGNWIGQTSASIRARVQTARDIQQSRFSNTGSDIVCNADMRVGVIFQIASWILCKRNINVLWEIKQGNS